VVSPEELKDRIENGLPGARANVTGDGRHFQAEVVSPEFIGRSRLEQHRMVYAVFGSELGDRIHALSLKTKTPEQP